MKLLYSIAAALMALLGLCSLSTAFPIEEDSDFVVTPLGEEEVDASTIPPVMESDMALAVADTPTGNKTYSVWNGHKITRGAPMQWCYVSYRGVYSHIEIWGRNWPMDVLGDDGYFLHYDLAFRLVHVSDWHFETCYPDKGEHCPAKKWRGFTWRASCISYVAVRQKVEQAILDLSPPVNQALEAGKGPQRGLCSNYQPDENGKNPGKWEGELEP